MQANFQAHFQPTVDNLIVPVNVCVYFWFIFNMFMTRFMIGFQYGYDKVLMKIRTCSKNRIINVQGGVFLQGQRQSRCQSPGEELRQTQNTNRISSWVAGWNLALLVLITKGPESQPGQWGGMQLFPQGNARSKQDRTQGRKSWTLGFVPLLPVPLSLLSFLSV